MARGKVLVVDDDLAVCRCLARLLEAGGLAPLATTDPSRAEALAGEGAELGLVEQG